MAYANAQNAWGRLYNSLGLDLTPAEPNADLGKLSSVLDESLQAWHKGVFSRPIDSAQATSPRVKLELEGVDGAIRASVRDGLVESLADQGVKVVDGVAPWTLVVTAELDAPVKAGGRAGAAGQVERLGRWNMALVSAAGKRAGSASYVSRLPHDVTQQMVGQMSRTAVEAYADFLADRLHQSSPSAVAQTPQPVSGVIIQ
ncbi:MAG: hypothetical protein R3E68_01205 [Burkholderiaceae bacterium]